MSRKDYIIIAEAMIIQINKGFIKKKNIEDAIDTMAKALKSDNYAFRHGTFRDYIMERI